MCRLIWPGWRKSGHPARAGVVVWVDVRSDVRVIYHGPPVSRLSGVGGAPLQWHQSFTASVLRMSVAMASEEEFDPCSDLARAICSTPRVSMSRSCGSGHTNIFENNLSKNIRIGEHTGDIKNLDAGEMPGSVVVERDGLAHVLGCHTSFLEPDIEGIYSRIIGDFHW